MRQARLIIAAVAAAAVVGAISFAAARQERAKPPPRLAYVYPDAVAPHNAADSLAVLDARLKGEEPLIRPGDWLSRSVQAARMTDRARLTGNVADYAAAGRMIEQAAASAGPRTGPALALAAWNLAVHRLGPASAALDRFTTFSMPDDSEQADARAMRGDIAFYRGDVQKALAAWIPSSTAKGVEQATRLALYYQKTGDPDEALRHLDEALQGRFITAQTAAYIHYQRGLIELQRGGWAAAEAAFADANRIFSGYWLYLQALAQMHALKGDMAGAVALYRRAIDAAHNPETMDALAALYRAQGDRAAADRWSAQAGAIWRQWLALLPDAAAAHALDHELAFGSPKQAAALAVANWRARPYGASATAMGWALLANGRPDAALRLIEALNATGWATAEQHVAAAQAAAMLGDTATADTERAAALALNPRIYDRAASMIWIGH